MVRMVGLLIVGAALALLVQGVGGERSFGEPRPPEPPFDSDVALLDVSLVFKRHSRFTAEMDVMKADVEKREAILAADRESIKTQEEALEPLDRDSDVYREGMDELTRLKAEFNEKMKADRQAFLDREAAIYFKALQQVEQVVKEYARANRIRMIIRHNTEWKEHPDREEILKRINKPVVYQNGLDITPEILAAVNATDAAP